MIIPIRCFTCGKIMADKSDYYDNEVLKKTMGIELDTEKAAKAEKKDMKAKKEKKSAKAKKDGGGIDEEIVEAKELYKNFDKIHTGDILDSLGLTRYCCRRNLISNVDMMSII